MILNNNRISILIPFVFIILIFQILFIPQISSNQYRFSYTPHDNIYINSNNQFTMGNGVVRGNGTKYNPFVIENWSIDATNSHGIWIENTNVYFIIRNCSIYSQTNQEKIYSGIYLRNVKNAFVINNKLTDSKYGIYIFHSENIEIINNKCDFNYIYNIALVSSFNNNIFNNTCKNSWYGIYIGNSTNNILNNNSCSNQKWYGIYLYSSSNNTLSNNICLSNDWNGIHHRFSSDNILINNKCLNNSWHGISIQESSNHNNIENNSCINQGWDGIYIDNSSLNIIKNNKFNNNSGYGVSLEYFSNNNSIEDNYCQNNKGGISVQHYSYLNIIRNNYCIINSWVGININFYSNNNSIINNKCNLNLENGILIYLFPKDNLIMNNYIENNKMYGILMDAPIKNNLIYNNYFNNTNNYFYNLEESIPNIWNVSKIIGRNILGGPILGGNYWSNYSGKDLNGDGFGDTNLPYGPGDFLPLIEYIETGQSGISDNTSSVPTTGEPFDIEAIAWSDKSVKNVYLKYWFDEYTPINITMNRISGTNEIGTYSKKINIQCDALFLHYIISIVDMSGNWKSIYYSPLGVIDNDQPLIIDNTIPLPTTGDNFTINATVTDNINLSIVRTEYWFNNGVHKNITLYLSSGYHQVNITIPTNATILNYLLSACDHSNNCKKITKVQLNVTDNDPPVIIDHSTKQPTTGDNFIFEFEITDNFDLPNAYLEYWFDNDKHINITFSWIDLFKETHSIIVPNSVKELHYIFYTRDINSNLAFIEKNLSVIDNDKPIIKDLNTEFPTTGEPFNFTVQILDNFLISKVNITYWFVNEYFYINMTKIGNNYTLSIQIPENVINLSYKILAIDTSGNNHSIEKTIEVIDNDKPLIEDYSYKTDESFIFLVDVYDNIGVSEVKVEYRFNNNDKEIKILKLNYDKYEGSISIPDDVDRLYYTISSWDLEGNKETTKEKEIELEQQPIKKPDKDLFWLLLAIIVLVIILVAIFVGYNYLRRKRKLNEKEEQNTIETIQNEKQKDVQNKSQESINKTDTLTTNEESSQLTQKNIPK